MTDGILGMTARALVSRLAAGELGHAEMLDAL